MTAFWTALIFILLAEMGDKTQLLALAFAARYRLSQVLGGIFVATAVIQFLAVAVGSWLTKIVPMAWIQVAAAVSFIGFGLWTIRVEGPEEAETRYSFSPFWTVAAAFFIAEMGDKTQLAVVALSAKYRAFFATWLGAVGGMVIADAIGIAVGMALGKKVPERFIKWGAASIFILFGLWGLYESLPPKYLTFPLITAFMALVAAAAFFIARGGRCRPHE